MIDFAIVGCGRIAKRHADLLGTGQIAGARLAAVCDIVPERAAAFAARYNVHGYTSLDEMLGSPGIDVVSVLTPSVMHAEHAIAVARSGRNVVVEKPMALPFLPAYARFGHGANDFPVAHGHQSRILSLPIFPEMTADQMHAVCTAVREIAA